MIHVPGIDKGLCMFIDWGNVEVDDNIFIFFNFYPILEYTLPFTFEIGQIVSLCLLVKMF